MKELPLEIQALCNSNFNFDVAKHPSDLLVKILSRRVVIGPPDSSQMHWCIDENFDRKTKWVAYMKAVE